MCCKKCILLKKSSKGALLLNFLVGTQMRQDKRSSSSSTHCREAVWSHLWNFALLYLVSRWNFFISSVTNGTTNKSEHCVETGIIKSGLKTDHEIQEKDHHHPSVNYLNKMIFQTCFLLLGLQLTNAVLLSQEEHAKIQAAYPNLKTRPRIARRLREGKIKQIVWKLLKMSHLNFGIFHQFSSY